MDISEQGLKLVEFYEGFLSRAVLDTLAVPHVWTVGYGETEGVHEGSTMTRAQAEADLKTRMNREYEPAVRLIPGLNQNQYDALCSFVWNVGPGAIAPGTGLGNLLRQKNWSAAAEDMLTFDRAGGVVIQGLINRRRAEVALFKRTPEAPDYPFLPLSLGKKGPFVWVLSSRLRKLGWRTDGGRGSLLTKTRTFGPALRGVVERFQKHHNLTVDGVVGPATWHAIKVRAKAHKK